MPSRSATARVSEETIDLVLKAVMRFGEETLSQPIDWVVYPDYADKPFVEAAIYNDASCLHAT